AKLLQLVNSAFFGLPQKIDHPGDALIYLGLENVKALVLSLQVFSLFDRVKVKQFSLEELWSHSWDVGCLARQIAACERRPTTEIETAFTAGLLHDVGKLVLISGVPHGWEEALETAAREDLPLWQAERNRLGACHAEAGAALLSMWGLSDEIVEAVAFHHEPDHCGSLSFTPLTAVHAANLLARKQAAAEESSYFESVGVRDRMPAWRERFLEPAV
ncbi:MAG: HDOD domain-containing protein, partial [Rhodospirillales bacterium]|nr:HDOD domain-containing protein [Rhodospirillales bacterium]